MGIKKQKKVIGNYRNEWTLEDRYHTSQYHIFYNHIKPFRSYPKFAKILINGSTNTNLQIYTCAKLAKCRKSG